MKGGKNFKLNRDHSPGKPRGGGQRGNPQNNRRLSNLISFMILPEGPSGYEKKRGGKREGHPIGVIFACFKRVY